MAPKIGIIGSGLIGRSWTMIFIANGFDVYLYDINEEKIDQAIKFIGDEIGKLESNNCLRGNISSTQQLKHIYKAKTLDECIVDAVHLQECVYECLDLKRNLFKEIDDNINTNDNVVICSSTSCFLPSKLFNGLKHCKQMIVGHPVNPPYFVPLVEIIPSEWTDPKIVEQTRSLMENVGQKPVTLRKEIQGFIVNRIQYAILNECYRLIESNIISVDDVDKVMSHGLGMRYAFMGPWETAHLNANGMKEYFDKYANGIYDVSMTFGPTPKMQGSTADLIATKMNKSIPLNQLNQRRKWRDQRLIQLAMLKKSQN